MERLPIEPGHAPDDVVESPPRLFAGVRDRWAARSLRQRLPILVPLAAVVLAAVVAYALMAARDWRADRAVADQVRLTATMGVASSSMSPPGGRLDFYASVRNAGLRPVSIVGVDVAEPGLLVSSGPAAQLYLEPGATVSVPVSVLLDCSSWRDPAPAGGEPAQADGTIEAVPASGRPRSVALAFGDWDAVLGVAGGVCAAHPDTVDLELDGPVLRRVRTG